MPSAKHRAPPHRRLWVLGAAAVLLLVTAGAFAWARSWHKAQASDSPSPALPSTVAPSVAVPSPATPAPKPQARPVRTVTISAVGDTMLGYQGHLPPSPATYLDPIRPQLAADIVFGNLEGTLTTTGTSKCTKRSKYCFAFRAPPSYAAYLARAGFTVMNSANNHSFDYGAEGAASTTAALGSAGIAQTGLPGQIAVVRANGVRVAIVGFAPYSDTASMLDLPAAQALIRKARGMADVVIVYMHAGAEGTSATHVTGATEMFIGENRGNPQAFAHMAIDAGADLVLGSGPHVVRGMEFYRDRLIAYSLGDFAGYGNFGEGGLLSDSCILKVTLTDRGRFARGRIVSVLLSGGRPTPDHSGTTAGIIAGLSRQDFGSAAARISPAGLIRPPAG